MSEPPCHQLPRVVLPPVVTVVEVMARYGFRDRRAARRFMDAVAAFRVGGRILVRAKDLLLDLLALMDGARIPGGCDHCDASQVVRPVEAGVWDCAIYHADDCPWWIAHQAAGVVA